MRAVGNLSELQRGGRPAHATAAGPRRVRVDHRHRRTPAGRPTGASPRTTPTRTSTPRTASTSSSTGSSRTTRELRKQLLDAGAEFTSETDAEVVAHLIAHHYDGDLVEAVRAAYNDLRGHYAFVAMSADEPGVLVGARKECPLIVGVGEGEQFLASAIPAFLARDAQRPARRTTTRSWRSAPTASQFLDADGRAGRARDDGGRLGRGDRREGRLRDLHAEGDPRAAGRGRRDDRRPHAGRPRRAAATPSSRTSCSRGIRRIVIVACGTSYHAGLVGRYAIEEWARMPVEMDIASEYRYRNPVVGPDDLVIGISQSGETADTLAAMRLARERRRHGPRHHERHGQPGHARRRRACCSRAPGSRSASPPRRRSSRRWRRCTCSG